MSKSKFLLVITLLVISIATLSGAMQEGSTTLGGVNGYVTLPKATVVDSDKNPSITTGYTAIFSIADGFAHIPFVLVGFAKNFEASVAFDIDSDDFDLMVNAKWRFVEKDNTSVAFGLTGEALTLQTDPDFAFLTYFATTFNSTFIKWPSKTTLLLGYTFTRDLNSNIDFGVGFEIPLWQKAFKGKVNLLVDFGNVSYSANPSGGIAKDRGLFNIGLRLLPLEFLPSTYFALDLGLIDIFDHQGRAFSAGAALTFRP
ncbi:MAG: hypothetical protein ACOXZ2_01165 [Sphaerochaetaceae bacterium]|jgi:hypothetical protein|nr:hypothetical protein [Sphaerochaetaceae bacterium]